MKLNVKIYIKKNVSREFQIGTTTVTETDFISLDVNRLSLITDISPGIFSTNYYPSGKAVMAPQVILNYL